MADEARTTTRVHTVVTTQSDHDSDVNAAIASLEALYLNDKNDLTILSVVTQIIPIRWGYEYNSYSQVDKKEVTNEQWIVQITYQFDESD